MFEFIENDDELDFVSHSSEFDSSVFGSDDDDDDGPSVTHQKDWKTNTNEARRPKRSRGSRSTELNAFRHDSGKEYSTVSLVTEDSTGSRAAILPCLAKNKDFDVGLNLNKTNKRKRVAGVSVGHNEKEILKMEKQRDKLLKKHERDVLKRMQPNVCMQYVTVWIDINLVNSKYGDEILRSVVGCGAVQHVTKQPIAQSIKWTTRTLVNGVEIDKEEAPILIIWNVEQFLTSIQDNTLYDNIKSLQDEMPGSKFTLVVFGLETYFSELTKQDKRNFRASVLSDETKRVKKLPKRFQNFNLTRIDVEDVLVDLQLLYDCPTRIADSVNDVASIVQQFTKSIGQTPYKLEKGKQRGEAQGWLASVDSKDCVRVDKSGNGLSRLWLQQLMQFNNSGLDIAQAIIEQYPTPLSLFKVYCSCDTSKRGEELLKDIVIRRGFGESAAKRKVGPELSKKLYYFFTSADANLPLSQD